MKKIAIVGTSPTSYLDAPYKDPDWEIWTLAANLTRVPRFDLFFEIHQYQALLEVKVDPTYLAGVKKIGERLVLGEPWPDCPEAKIYPKEKIRAEFGNYLNSSIALMIAYALQEGATSIGLWGVDMAAGSEEYGYQKGCCEYLLGIAKGRGVEVIIAKESPLLRGTRIYGLDSDGFSNELCARRAELEQEIAKLDGYVKKRDFLQGALDLVNDQLKRWG